MKVFSQKTDFKRRNFYCIECRKDNHYPFWSSWLYWRAVKHSILGNRAAHIVVVLLSFQFQALNCEFILGSYNVTNLCTRFIAMIYHAQVCFRCRHWAAKNARLPPLAIRLANFSAVLFCSKGPNKVALLRRISVQLSCITQPFGTMSLLGVGIVFDRIELILVILNHFNWISMVLGRSQFLWRCWTVNWYWTEFKPIEGRSIWSS